MWDKEADVVIVGYGGAGATAAIKAHDTKARVTILEKSAEGGGNTVYSAGSIRQILDADKVTAYIQGFAFGAADIDTIRSYVDGCIETPAWITELGGNYQEHDAAARARIFPPAADVLFPNLPGAEGLGTRWNIMDSTVDSRGIALWGFLVRNIEKRKIEVLYNTAAKQLMTNENKEVTGVVADSPEGEIRVKAKRGVILACGGFEYNEEMLNQFLGIKIPAFGTPANTGDGVKMAQEIGADLWHMTGVSCSPGYVIPDIEIAVIHRMRAPGYIYVDQNGSRFADEMIDEHAFLFSSGYIDHKNLRYARIPSYVIFDEDTRRAGPIVKTDAGKWTDFYQWSDDNSAEVEKGWIKRGNTVADLALQIGMRVEALQEAVAEYNTSCIGCYDPKFNRPPDTLVPIARSPFYAIAIWPCLINTQGGPRRNARGEVLDVWGHPIKRLYSAGELGSLWGIIYPGGGNVTECLASGRIAGKNAALQGPWDS